MCPIRRHVCVRLYFAHRVVLLTTTGVDFALSEVQHSINGMNPNPSPATRFGSPDGPINRGRPSRRWLKERMSGDASAHDDVKRFIDATKSNATTIREAMLERLIQIAFTDEVIVLGKDSDGELLKRMSSRESLEAIKTAYAYDQGKPPPSDAEIRLKLAEHFRQVARDSVDLALKVLGDKIKEMPPQAIAEALQAFSVNPRGFLEAAEAHVGVGAPKEQIAPPPGPDFEPRDLTGALAAPEPPQLEPQADAKVEGEP